MLAKYLLYDIVNQNKNFYILKLIVSVSTPDVSWTQSGLLQYILNQYNQNTRQALCV